MTITIKKCLCTVQREKSILVLSKEFLELGEKEAKCWIPQDSIHDDSDVYKLHDIGNLILKEDWFAEKKGWL